MINVFHGDDLVSSRKALPQGLHFDAKELTKEKLEQLLTSNELFGETKPIIIEGLIDLIETKKEVYLWVGKRLSAAQLKKFSAAKIREFKISPVLWQFLRTRKLVDLEKTLTTEPVELVWYLLHRQAAKRGDTGLLKKMFAVELALKSGESDVPLRTRLELLL